MCTTPIYIKNYLSTNMFQILSKIFPIEITCNLSLRVRESKNRSETKTKPREICTKIDIVNVKFIDFYTSIYIQFTIISRQKEKKTKQRANTILNTIFF